MTAVLLALTLTALTTAGIAVRNAANAAGNMRSACPANSPPKVSASTPPIT